MDKIMKPIFDELVSTAKGFVKHGYTVGDALIFSVAAFQKHVESMPIPKEPKKVISDIVSSLNSMIIAFLLRDEYKNAISKEEVYQKLEKYIDSHEENSIEEEIMKEIEKETMKEMYCENEMKN